MDSNSLSNMPPEGSISPTRPGPNRENSKSKTQSQNSMLTETLGLVEPSRGKAGIGFNKNASNQTNEGKSPSVDRMTAIADKDGNPVVMEDPWGNASIDSNEFFQSFQPLDCGAGGAISDMNVYRSLTPNDTPESSRSGGSELFSEISEGFGLDINLDIFNEEWMPFGPSDADTLFDMNSFNVNGDEDDLLMFDDDQTATKFGSWDDMVDSSAPNKPFSFDLNFFSMNTGSPPQAQRHSESQLSPVSRPTRRYSEILIVPESQTSTLIGSDSSAGFETDSTWSGEESDWGEDVPQIYDHLGLLAQDMGDPDLSIRPLLTPMKQELVDGIMREFWIIFNQEWCTNIQKHSGGSPQSTSSSISQHNNKSGKQSTSRGQKRERKDDDENSEGNDGRNPKRPKVDFSPPKSLNERMKFACPYRKHDPRKYCHQTRRWRSCALTPLDTIARVKGHLYRYHRIFQCPRCKVLHKNPDDLEKHTLAVKACEVIHQQPVEGITGNVEKKLKSRKKAHRDQSETERWQEIYRILFPEEGVPSPYFEAIQDDIIRSPDSEELTSYEEYSRRELPRFFQSALEAAIANEAQPIEERLRSQLVGMIQDCQDRVFSTYKARRSTDTPTPAGLSLPLDPSQSPLPDDEQKGNPLEDDQKGIVETLYERPPLQTSLPSHPETAVAEVTLKALVENAPSDSGYISEPPILNSERSSNGDVAVSEAITAGSSQHQQSPKTPQLVQEARAELNTYQSFSFQEACAHQGEENEFPGIPTSEFDMDQSHSYGTEFTGFDLEMWVPFHGEETEQGDLWNEWSNFQ